MREKKNEHSGRPRFVTLYVYIWAFRKIFNELRGNLIFKPQANNQSTRSALKRQKDANFCCEFKWSSRGDNERWRHFQRKWEKNLINLWIGCVFLFCFFQSSSCSRVEQLLVFIRYFSNPLTLKRFSSVIAYQSIVVLFFIIFFKSISMEFIFQFQWVSHRLLTQAHTQLPT